MSDRPPPVPPLFRSILWSALPERSIVGQLLDLLREEPPLRFRRGEAGGAFERSSGGHSLPEPTQHRAAGCVQQVIRVEVGAIASIVASAASGPSISAMAIARLSATTSVGINEYS
jgi:hypothetical protein